MGRATSKGNEAKSKMKHPSDIYVYGIGRYTRTKCTSRFHLRGEMREMKENITCHLNVQIRSVVNVFFYRNLPDHFYLLGLYIHL